jgi:hypothetical protein
MFIAIRFHRFPLLLRSKVGNIAAARHGRFVKILVGPR